jgi:hypothetical protein
VGGGGAGGRSGGGNAPGGTNGKSKTGYSGGRRRKRWTTTILRIRRRWRRSHGLVRIDHRHRGRRMAAVEEQVQVLEFQLTEQQELTQHLQHRTHLGTLGENGKPTTQVTVVVEEPEVVDLLEVKVVMVDQETTVVLVVSLDLNNAARQEQNFIGRIRSNAGWHGITVLHFRC